MALELIRRDFPDYHPLIALARLAHSKEAEEDPRFALEVHKTVLPYVVPKLSSVEVKEQGDPDDRRVIVSLFDQVQLEDGRMVDVEVPLVTDVSELVRLDAD